MRTVPHLDHTFLACTQTALLSQPLDRGTAVSCALCSIFKYLSISSSLPKNILPAQRLESLLLYYIFVSAANTLAATAASEGPFHCLWT